MKALVTGVSGQDGSYLSELLLKAGLDVVGMHRRSAAPNMWRLADCITHPNFSLIEGDLTDTQSINSIVKAVQPDYLFNLAANSYVKSSFNVPESVIDTNGTGVIRLLEALKNYSPDTIFYQASTSELYGSNSSIYYPQNENTPFMPASPYGLAKLLAYHAVKHYKSAYGLYAYQGVLFNHESSRRGINFVTRKISHTVAQISCGAAEVLSLGNLNASRDWGHARDYVECMWRLVNQNVIDTVVIGSGVTYTVREFCDAAFKVIDMPLTWEGHGINEVGRDKDGHVRVKVDPQYFRPEEVGYLLSDPSLAQSALDWNPQSTTFEQMVIEMVIADCNRFSLGVLNEF
jgi:GDPmannose 4,6-dehydratase